MAISANITPEQTTKSPIGTMKEAEFLRLAAAAKTVAEVMQQIHGIKFGIQFDMEMLDVLIYRTMGAQH